MYVRVLSKAVSKTLNFSSKAVGVKAFGFKEERNFESHTNRRFVSTNIGMSEAYGHNFVMYVLLCTLERLTYILTQQSCVSTKVGSMYVSTHYL